MEMEEILYKQFFYDLFKTNIIFLFFVSAMGGEGGMGAAAEWSERISYSKL